MAYEPPENNSIPFNFTRTGYTAPTDELLFNFKDPGEFANLQAQIQVLQLHKDEHHVYRTTCPKYVVGYQNGRVQVIQGPCTYHALRDLGARLVVRNTSTSDLQGLIDGVAKSDSSDLSAYIKTKFPRDLGGIIGGHLPEDLLASIIGDQLSYGDLPASIHSWEENNLTASIGMHSPRDLQAQIDIRSIGQGDITGAIRGWDTKDLSASVNTALFKDLPGYLNTIQPVDLPAYIRVQPSGNLSANVRSWVLADLQAQVRATYFKDLPATITGYDDLGANTLRARIKGVGSGYYDLQGIIQAMQHNELPAYLKPIYLGNLIGIIAPVAPVNLRGLLHGWKELDLPAYINAQDYPYNLPASIYPDGKFSDLSANIKSAIEVYANRDLRASVHPWEIRYLSAQIYVDSPGDLGAYINPLGYSSDLHAYIRPKMIRLTTYVSVPTMERLDLSAIINAACVHSGSSSLSASMYIKYKSDLLAFIRPLQYDYKPSSIGASIGYADSFTEVDKYNLRITIKESEFYTEDMYRFIINIASQEHFLSASINGTYMFNNLSAQISSLNLPSYTYNTVSKNTEKVINTTYAGVLQGYKTVEIAFEDMVKDYHYSPVGDYAWKTDRFQRWMLSVESFIPANVAINLARKLYRATIVYNFARFDSFDEAMKNAIAYVTEQPVSNLGATIYNKGWFNDLGASIGTRTFVNNARSTLGSSITGHAAPIVVGTASGVQKI